MLRIADGATQGQGEGAKQFCSTGLPPGLRKTCGTLVRSSKIRGSPHKPRGPALQIKKRLIALRRAQAATVNGAVTLNFSHVPAGRPTGLRHKRTN